MHVYVEAHFIDSLGVCIVVLRGILLGYAQVEEVSIPG